MPNSTNIWFAFTCQRCGSVLEATSALCGQKGRCPTCGAVFSVPLVDERTGLVTGPALVADDGQLPTPMHAYASAGARAPQIVRKEGGEQVIVCPRCNREMPIEANLCSACGVPFTMEGADAVVRGVRTDGLAVAALAVGVISVFTACLPVLGPIAVGLGWRACARRDRAVLRRRERGMAIAGIVCGFASIAVFAALWAFG